MLAFVFLLFFAVTVAWRRARRKTTKLTHATMVFLPDAPLLPPSLWSTT